MVALRPAKLLIEKKTILTMLFETLLILIGLVIFRDTYYFILYLSSLKRKKSKKDYNGKYTIIIPNYNKTELDACLKSIYPDNIIIVDDGSENKEILKKWENKVKIYYLKHEGKYNALNYGIEHSSGEIVILDSDTFTNKESLRKLLSNLENFDAVAGNIQVHKEKTLISRIQAIEHIRIAMFKRIALVKNEISFIPGPFAAFKRTVFESEKFRRSRVEDLVFSENIKKKFKITYEPDAVAYTAMPKTLKTLYAQRKYWAAGNIEFYKKKNLWKLFSYYYLAVLDIFILLFSFLSWNFIPLLFFLIFESSTMIFANKIEKGNCIYESIIFPVFMYFLAFFYLSVYVSAFIEVFRTRTYS
ncbi:MAG: glycosyltransferase family 2 protein [Methanomicrobia archaeon]|nr:glycosyltransferase family 2 protein [Methanomicrobia archaeon]